MVMVIDWIVVCSMMINLCLLGGVHGGGDCSVLHDDQLISLLGGVHGDGDCSVFHDDQPISLLGGVHGDGDCSVFHDDQLSSLLVVFMVVEIVVCFMMIN